MLPTNLHKIEVWKKKGGGPWIILRLEPSKTNEDADLRLAEIIFRPISGGEVIYNQVSADAWKRYNGYRAIVIFLLLAAALRNNSVSPGDVLPIITTPLRPSWPNTFSELTQEKKFLNSDWLQGTFGIMTNTTVESPLENRLARIAKISGRAEKAVKNQQEEQRVLANPDSSAIKLFLNTQYLNPRNITIIKKTYADPADQGLISPIELRRLASVLESVESKWRKLLLRVASADGSAKLTQISTTAARPLDKSSLISPNVEEISSPNTKSTGSSLAELFRSQSVESIISHIVAALLPSRGADAVEKSYAEILSPHCINVIAEQLVGGSIDAFCNFFIAEFDSPPSIKTCVAAVIASNKELRAKHAANVARGGYWDIVGWFSACSFFCKREIVVEIENALNLVAHEPGFKAKFEIYDPPHLRKLIDLFASYGCVSAVHLFEQLVRDVTEQEKKLNQLLS